LNVLRLEGGFVVPGWETAQTFEDDELERTPAELGISWTVDLDREDNFIGKTALLKEKEDGPRFKTIGLTIEQKCDPDEAVVYSMVNGIRQQVGNLTSVAWSHRLNCYVALASVRPLAQGSSYHLEIGGQEISCRETSLPFVNFDRYRQTPAPCK